MIYIQESMFLLQPKSKPTFTPTSSLIHPRKLPSFYLPAAILCQSTRPSSLGPSISCRAVLGIELHCIAQHCTAVH